MFLRLQTFKKIARLWGLTRQSTGWYNSNKTSNAMQYVGWYNITYCFLKLYWISVELILNGSWGNSKRYKTDEKITQFVVHVYPSTFDLKKNSHYTQQPFKNTVGRLKRIPNVDRETCTNVCQFFGVWLRPPKIFITL